MVVGSRSWRVVSPPFGGGVPLSEAGSERPVGRMAEGPSETLAGRMAEEQSERPAGTGLMRRKTESVLCYLGTPGQGAEPCQPVWGWGFSTQTCCFLSFGYSVQQNYDEKLYYLFNLEVTILQLKR